MPCNIDDHMIPLGNWNLCYDICTENGIPLPLPNDVRCKLNTSLPLSTIQSTHNHPANHKNKKKKIY